MCDAKARRSTRAPITVVIVTETLMCAERASHMAEVAARLRGVLGANVRVWTFRRAAMDGSYATWSFVDTLARRLRRTRPDLVLSFGTSAGLACGLLWRPCAVGHFIWVQDGASPIPHDRRLEPLALAWTPEFVALSDQARLFLVEALGIAPERITGSSDQMLAFVDRAVAATSGRDRRRGFFDTRLVLRAVFRDMPDFAAPIEALAARLHKDGRTRIAIWGTGQSGQALAAACRRRRITVEAFADPNPARWGQSCDGTIIQPIASILSSRVRTVAITGRTGQDRGRQIVEHAARKAGVRLHLYSHARPSGIGTVAPTSHHIEQSDTSRMAEVERLVAPVVERLRRAGHGDITIYGASGTGRAILRVARRQRVPVRFFVDSDPTRWDDEVEGVQVVSIGQAMEEGTHRYAVGSFGNAVAISETIARLYRGHDVEPVIVAPAKLAAKARRPARCQPPRRLEA